MATLPMVPFVQNENAGSVFKKPDSNVFMRTPFKDRGVNAVSPKHKNFVKPKSEKSRDNSITKKEEDAAFIDFASFKQLEDDFEDICPKTECLRRTEVLNIMQAYVGFGRSTPTKDIEPMFSELPENCFNSFSYIDGMSLDEVSLPEIY